MGSGVRRTNLNIKTAIDITKNLTLQINPKLSFRRDEGAGGDNIGTGGIIDVLRYRPTNGLREFGYIDPSYADPDEEALFTYTNPKSDISINQQKKYSYNYTNAFSLEWKPIKGLVLRSEATIGLTWKDQYRFYGALTSEGQKNNSQPVANIQKDYTFKYIWTNTASYGFTLKNVHNISLLLGQEIYHSQNTKNVQKNRYFPRAFEAEQAWANMGFGTPQESYTQLSTPDRTASFFGQASYNYNHKYLLSLTMRADGSTKFAPGNQWGYFPSISGAWVLSEENFLNDVEWIDQLKLRAAFGLAGNNRIDNDMWRYLYSVNSTGGPGFGESTQFGEQWYGNQGNTTFANKDIKWETTLTRNLAADITLFGGRLTVTPEVYWNTTKDLLYNLPISATTGFTSYLANVGQLNNKGVEFELRTLNFASNDFNWTTVFNLTHNKNKIVSLNGQLDQTIEGTWFIHKVGLPYHTFYVKEFAGVNTQNGKAEYYKNKVNEDGTIDRSLTTDPNEAESIPFKSVNPKVSGGLTNILNYKWLDLSFTLTYSLGGYSYDKLGTSIENGTESIYTSRYNLPIYALERWQQPGDQTDVPRFVFGEKATVTNSSRYIHSTDHLRLKNLTLGFTLPDQWTSKALINKARVYFSGSNLLTWAKWKQYDPETPVNGEVYCEAPPMRTFSFGVQLTF